MLCLLLKVLAVLSAICISDCNITAVKHAYYCLPEPIPEQDLRFLIYNDQTKHSVRIPYASWTSARIAAEVMYILMREVLGYSVLVLDGTSSISSQPVNYVAGCMDANDAACVIKDEEKPVLHLTVETWAFGISRASALPQSVSPILLNVLNYKTTSQWYVWQDVVDAGANADEQLVLDYYKSYRNTKFKPHNFFDHWTKIYELIPSQYIARCSELGPKSYQDRMSDRYIELTKDTDVGCHFNDTIWFSKSCRANTSECIPLLLQYNYVSAMQLSFFLDMPLAIVKVYDGSEEFDRVYYSAIRRGKFIFDWFQPDDSLADEYGRLPVLLILPPMKPLEQSQHIYKTGYASVSPRNYCWKGLPAVDRHVAQLASKINLYDEDMDNMMLASRRLKDGNFKETSVEFRVACDWVRQHERRWRPWIPARCPPAAAPDPTLTACLPCAQGSFCQGGFDGPAKCPAGHYCPANTSRAVPCPQGRSTADGGARQEGDCAVCAGGYVLLSDGSCAATASALSLIVILVAAAAAAAAALALRLRASRSQAQWAVKPSEIVMDAAPDVLGCGSQSAVVRALYRGTPVAIKYFLPPQARACVQADRDAVPIERAHPGESLLHFEWSYSRSRRSKVSPVQSVGAHGVDRALLGAILQMARVRHPSVATVMGVAELAVGGHRRACVVMELYELGCLRDLLQNRSYFLHGETALSLLLSVAQGMRFLHEARPPLLHGALKSSNVLIDTKHGAKISDWGLPPPRLGPPGPAPLWAAPEVLRGQVRASREADVYSFGVVLYEVLSRRPPFGGEDSDVVAVAIADGSMRLPVPRGCSVEAAALMNECLAFASDDRPHFGEVGRRLSALHHSQMTSEAVLPSEPALPGETPLPRLRRQRFSSCRFSPLLPPAAVSAASDQHTACFTDVLPPPALAASAATGKLEQQPSAASLTHQVCESAQTAPPAVESESFCLRDTKMLIRRLFPLHVADALMRGERVPPQHLDMVTMFFSDVVGFTDLSASTAPEKVGDLLDRLYGRFDALADVHGVSKLETIGDAYLCATNLAGDQIADHAARLARFAIAAVSAARDTLVDPDDASRGSVRIRVGLHSGPCMASVVGNRFPKYTLLGDTVNTASRMESHSVPGRVQCTARTAELIRAQDATIPLAPRGETIIKGKGPMFTFWVLVDSDEPGATACLPVTGSADSIATTAVPFEGCEDQDADEPVPGPPPV